MSLLALLTFTVAALVAGLVAGALLNRKAFEARREAKVAELFAGVETLPTYFRTEDIVELPESAQRYLLRNLNEGMPHQSCMRVCESGSLRQQFGQPWTEFVGEGYMTATPAALVWFARLRPLPLVWLDELCLVGPGRVQLSSKLLSSITTADERSDAARRRALFRYVAHLPLLPGAMLPGDDRGWRGIPLDAGAGGDPDDTPMRDDAAEFWLRDGEIEVSGVFEFDELGNVLRFWTDSRPLDRGVGKGAREGRWVVRYGEHRGFGSGDDLFLPTRFEIEWEVGGETFGYLDKTIREWRLDIPRSWRVDPA